LQKLDRYVSSYFISSYGICLLFFLGMFVLIDLFGKTDDIFDNYSKVAALGHSVFTVVGRYYALMLPFIFLQVAPFVTVMAAMFAITRLRRNNELVPMIVAGRSVFRVMAPVFVFAVLLALGMVAIQQWIAPDLADARERTRDLLVHAEEDRTISDFFSVGENRYVTIHDYDLDTRTIAAFDVSDMNLQEPSVQGANAWWDEQTGAFLYEAELADETGEAATVVRELPADLTPDLIESKVRGAYDLSYSQAEFLYGKTGERRWKVLLHYHLTFPLSNLLLLMLGMPFVLRQESRSLLLGMVISILICAAYFAFDAVMRNLGDKDVLHPVLAAWFGVIFFGSLGVVLVDNIKT